MSAFMVNKDVIDLMVDSALRIGAPDIREHVKLGHEIGETTLARDLERNAVNVRRALLAYCRSQRPKMTPRLINNGQGFWGWC